MRSWNAPLARVNKSVRGREDEWAKRQKQPSYTVTISRIVFVGRVAPPQSADLYLFSEKHSLCKVLRRRRSGENIQLWHVRMLFRRFRGEDSLLDMQLKNKKTHKHSELQKVLQHLLFLFQLFSPLSCRSENTLCSFFLFLVFSLVHFALFLHNKACFLKFLGFCSRLRNTHWAEVHSSALFTLVL